MLALSTQFLHYTSKLSINWPVAVLLSTVFTQMKDQF
jgi:hypothetical protein